MILLEGEGRGDQSRNRCGSNLIIVVGAAVLVLSTIFLRPWVFAGWVKPAFWLLGLACMVWAALKLLLLFHGHAMSRQMYHFFDSQQPFMLGVASATLILFFISGEASRGVARWRELKKERSCR